MVLIELILLNVFNTFLLTSAKSHGSSSSSVVVNGVGDSIDITWTARRNSDITEEFRSSDRAGTILKVDSNFNFERVVHDPDFIASLPESFDPRKQWPMCSSLFHVQTQGPCDSSWANAISAMITDRYCIKSNETKEFNFSVQDLTSCDTDNNGCNGGQLDRGLNYWLKTGVVSGGDYQSNEGCYPYEIPPLGGNQLTPPCRTTCRAGYNMTYLNDKKKGKNVYSVVSEGNMMAEIYKNGPIVSAFQFYYDFYYYQTGIYRHRSGKPDGAHTVKTIGWGVENGVKFWLMSNSWGSGWGENGYFRMLRGANECKIEEWSYAGEPIL